MAIALHGFERYTDTVEILTTRQGLGRIHARLVGGRYVRESEGVRRTFRDTVTGGSIRIFATGEYPGDRRPKPIAFPDPRDAAVNCDGYDVLRVRDLVELRLAAGLWTPNNLRDLADVQDLILALELPRDLGKQLDTSVQYEYYRIWDVAQTPDYFGQGVQPRSSQSIATRNVV